MAFLDTSNRMTFKQYVQAIVGYALVPFAILGTAMVFKGQTAKILASTEKGGLNSLGRWALKHSGADEKTTEEALKHAGKTSLVTGALMTGAAAVDVAGERMIDGVNGVADGVGLGRNNRRDYPRERHGRYTSRVLDERDAQMQMGNYRQ